MSSAGNSLDVQLTELCKCAARDLDTAATFAQQAAGMFRLGLMNSAQERLRCMNVALRLAERQIEWARTVWRDQQE